MIGLAEALNESNNKHNEKAFHAILGRLFLF